MVGFTLRTAITALLLATSLVAALPTSATEFTVRDAVFHGDAVKDAAVAPLPHGWYGHNATTPTDRLERLKARDASVEAAANIAAAYRSLSVKRDHSTDTYKESKRVNNEAYEYDDDGHVIVHGPSSASKRDYPDAFEQSEAIQNGKVAKRFSDAGAAPAASWFPSWIKRSDAASNTVQPRGAKSAEKKRGKERRIPVLDKRIAGAIKNRLMVRSADPLACASHNYKCRSIDEAREMADFMAGRR